MFTPKVSQSVYGTKGAFISSYLQGIAGRGSTSSKTPPYAFYPSILNTTATKAQVAGKSAGQIGRTERLFPVNPQVRQISLPNFIKPLASCDIRG